MAYLLSKLLPLPLPPHGLNPILIVLVVRQIGRWHWPVLSAFCCFGIFFGSGEPVSLALERGSLAASRNDGAAACDAIVTLSGGRHPAPGAS